MGDFKHSIKPNDKGDGGVAARMNAMDATEIMADAIRRIVAYSKRESGSGQLPAKNFVASIFEKVTGIKTARPGGEMRLAVKGDDESESYEEPCPHVGGMNDVALSHDYQGQLDAGAEIGRLALDLGQKDEVETPSMRRAVEVGLELAAMALEHK